MSHCMLALFMSPELEDSVIDWLLAQTDVEGFIATKVDGHGVTHDALSVAEQVAGRERLRMLQLFASIEVARRVIAGLTAEFPSAAMRYQLLPALEGGRIG